jgi:cholesterol transport system auxiliary component
MIRFRRLLIATLTFLLGACAALSGKHGSFSIYAPQLTTSPAPAPASPALDWQLLIEQPRASSALDTTRIAVMPRPGVLEVYADARWRDPAPALLRSLLVEAFERDGRVPGVSSSDSGISADYALAMELRDFQIEIDGDGNAAAVVRLTVKLLDRKSNRIVASQSFAESAAAAGSDPSSAFPAFSEALNRVLPAIVEWTVSRAGNGESGMENG